MSRKKQTRRHKPKNVARAATIEERAAHRWLHDADVPIRQIARGVLGDFRVMGDRADEMQLAAAERLLLDRIQAMLESKNPTQQFRGARLLLRLREQRDSTRRVEAGLVTSAMEAHLSEVVAKWQASLDAQGDRPTLEDMNAAEEEQT